MLQVHQLFKNNNNTFCNTILIITHRYNVNRKKYIKYYLIVIVYNVNLSIQYRDNYLI